MSFFEIITTYILPSFVPTSVLDKSLGLSFWNITIGDLFGLIFSVVFFVIATWFLIILPYKIFRKLTRIDKGARH